MKFYKIELSRLESCLEQLTLDAPKLYNTAEHGIQLCRDSLNTIRKRVLKKGFDTIGEECEFFKTIKPQIVGHLIFYLNLIDIEIQSPIDTKKAKQKFYIERITHLRDYFIQHRGIYEYYTRNFSHLDREYFTRNNCSQNYCESISSLIDTQFSTAKDMLFAQIIGNIKTIEYLKQKIAFKTKTIVNHNGNVAALQWTGTKVDLVELIYALQASTLINNGNVEIKELATAMEQLFGIKVGDYYRMFLEIRMRKSNHSKLLDTLKVSLINKITIADN